MRRIYLTVDTECHHFEKLNESITGDTGNGVYGLEKILQLGVELGIPVNVFLDVAECHRYGDDYVRNIVALVRRYNQPLCLHIHPDFIGDAKRKHLWEYTKEEQREILRTGLEDFSRFCGEWDRLVFRAGAWGVNSDTYDVLRELVPEGKEILDLSYTYGSRWRCHLSCEEYGAANAARRYRGVTCLPNTAYGGFDYFGKKRALGICVPTLSLPEFRQLIDRSRLSDITYTMHSWDFIKRWFFLPGKIAGDKALIRNFKRCAAYARKQGYVFSSLYDYEFKEEEDQYQNLCETRMGRLKCLWYNYRRFARMGRSYKKYAVLYFSQFVFPALLLLLFLILIF